MKNKKITIIGSGFSALAASAYLAQSGHDVILKKTQQLEGEQDN
jgi:phytoene desaturase